MKSPSEAFSNPQVEATRRFLSRYQPFIVTVTALVLIAVFLPGRSNAPDAGEQASELSSPLDEDFDTGDTGSGPKVAGKKAGDPLKAGPAQVNPQVLTFEEAQKRGLELVANCDSATGKVKVPSRFAPPCTQKFTAPNGGASWVGVTDKEINVTYFRAEGNAAVDAFLAAAGANDSDEEVEATVIGWGKLLESHFNMWGRTVKWKFRDATGDAEDDQAAIADARAIVKEDKALAVINASNNTMVNELVANKVLCFCTVSLPIETYIKWSPYVWTTLMASTQGYIHRAAYVARINGKNAVWAQDSVSPLQSFADEKRRFGFIYYETENYDYKSGAEFFVKYLKEKYNITIPKDAVSQYNGYPDITKTQEQSPGLIQRMRDSYGGKGATSLICSCDPFGPAFFTKDAQSARYGPEWIITGSALTDTSFFARTYNQDQWKHAFGISYLAARLPEEKGGSARLWRWHYGADKFPPPAEAGYGVIYAPIAIMYNGYHMAGPVLTPATFRLGMYSLPIQGKGGITTIASSFGNKGLWPWAEDPVAADDATEIWWDAEAEGEDEIGIDGTGLYRYVLGGKRYLSAEWPKTTPTAFNKKGTVLIYENPPPADQWPCYPSPASGKTDLC